MRVKDETALDARPPKRNASKNCPGVNAKFDTDLRAADGKPGVEDVTATAGTEKVRGNKRRTYSANPLSEKHSKSKKHPGVSTAQRLRHGCSVTDVRLGDLFLVTLNLKFYRMFGFAK